MFLNLRGIHFRSKQRRWHEESEMLRQVFECARASGCWWDFANYRKNSGSRYYSLKSVDGLLGDAKAAKRHIEYELTPERFADGSCPCFLRINAVESRLEVQLGLEGRYLKEKADGILDRLIDYTSRLHDALQKDVLFGPELEVTMPRTPYPRPRPPRWHRHWGAGSLVVFMSKEFQRSDPLGSPADLEKILAAPMPAGASREDRGDLVVVRWVSDVRDKEEVARQRTAEDEWMADVLSLPVPGGWNDRGDHQADLFDAARREPLTFYGGFQKYGYKAVVINPDGTVDEELFAEMAEWIKSRKLPDGTPLEALHFILPNRDSALQIRSRASAMGVGMVLYADDQGNLWDPVPPGMWVNKRE